MSSITQQPVNNEELSSALLFFINLTKLQSLVSRRFDSIGNGLSFNDFIILHHLYQAEDCKLRRVDLAERVGMTASGVTKLLPAMEKVGLVIRESNPRDARVSYVKLAPGGKRLYEYSIDNANYLADNAVPEQFSSKMTELNDLVKQVRQTLI